MNSLHRILFARRQRRNTMWQLVNLTFLPGTQGIKIEFIGQRGSTSVSHTSATFFSAQCSENPTTTDRWSLVIWPISGFGSGFGSGSGIRQRKNIKQ